MVSEEGWAVRAGAAVAELVERQPGQALDDANRVLALARRHAPQRVLEDAGGLLGVSTTLDPSLTW